MSQVVLNVVPKNEEKPHVADHMHPPPMQKQRRKEGNHDRDQRILRRARQKQPYMGWHYSKLTNQQLQAPRIEHGLEQINQKAQPNQKVVHPRSAVSRLIV